MNEKRFKKLVREYPFLIDDTYQISLTEAQAIRAKGFPSGQKIVDGAKAKYKDLPVEAWKVYDDAFATQTVQKNEKEMPIRTVSKAQQFAHRHSRLVAACIIVAILLSFFTLVPAGRALAAEIIRFFAEVFGNRIEVTIEGQGFNNHDEDVYIEAKTHAELGNIGIEPFALDMEWLVIESVVYESSVVEKTIFTVYRTNLGSLVYTIQRWDIETSFSLTANVENYEELFINKDQVLYISKDQDDGNIEGVMFREYDMILITTKDQATFDDIMYKFAESD